MIGESMQRTWDKVIFIADQSVSAAESEMGSNGIDIPIRKGDDKLLKGISED